MVTLIFPVVAPFGTLALRYVLETTVNVVAFPLNVTLVAPLRLFPRILIDCPALPKLGFAVTQGPSPVDKLYTVPQP